MARISKKSKGVEPKAEPAAGAQEELAKARAALATTLALHAAQPAAASGPSDEEKQAAARRADYAKVVRNYLRKIKFHFSERKEKTCIVFSGSICASCDIIDVFQWQIVVDEDYVWSDFELPTHANTAERRVKIAEFCAFVNYDLKDGKLMEDIGGDGGISFHLCVPGAALATGSDDEVDRLIGLPVFMLERYTPGVIAVLQGCEPGDAFEKCCLGDDGSDESGEQPAADASASASAPSTEKGSEVEGRPAAKGTAAARGRRNGMPSEDNGPDYAKMFTQPVLASNYSLDGLNLQGNVSLDQVVVAVRRFVKGEGHGEDAPRMNILLSGPSGSGKTEFAKYLSYQVGRPVMTVSVSDVLCSLVGKTEQRVAEIFDTAQESNSILFLDEVDSLLSSRTEARHQWEVTQVNELLQRMERFGGVLICATNFADHLDSAVLRRFTFKLKLDYLTDEGKSMFFQRFFKEPLTPAETRRLVAIPNLTPGDFRTVRQSLYYLAGQQDNASRIAALEAESAAKGSSGQPRVGF